jgi:RimJ/RimL family protein N-acetyltransferase
MNAPSSYYNQSSDRIQFRKLTEADKLTWQSFFVDNDHLRFVAQDPALGKAFLSDRWINYQLDHYSKDNFGLLALIEKSTGAFIGQAGILVRDIKGKREYEIGYSLKQEFWRKGLASEASQHLKEYGRSIKLAPRFISMIHPENLGSIKVAEKNGFKYLFDATFMEMDLRVYGEEL